LLLLLFWWVLFPCFFFSPCFTFVLCLYAFDSLVGVLSSLT
jgi:hypothetical protein